jgi:hypothetical protein
METDKRSIKDLFPEGGRVLLTGGGKAFIERIGVDAAKRVVLSVLKGENLRTQTEPLTRRRIAQVSGAMVYLFARGWTEIEGFTDQLSDLAIQQIKESRRNDNANIWPAQWLIGLTGKSVQNVLRSDPEQLAAYVSDFENAVNEAAEQCQRDMPNPGLMLGVVEDRTGTQKKLMWKDITRLTTAIGSLTLTIRGSDKSIYGKLFERLILGSILSILGFQRVNPATNTLTRNVFWLSDSSDDRESDATVLLKPGKLIRFDIGFIGPGNSEISKDKLSRYAREFELKGRSASSKTFVIVDRLPNTSKTSAVAKRIGAEIVQMSMQYWPRELAQRLSKHMGYLHELSTISDEVIGKYLEDKLKTIRVQEFLTGVSVAQLEGEENP